MNFRFAVLTLIASYVGACTPCFGQVANAADGSEHFPAAKLRAYGTVFAERKLISGSPLSSVLFITCESEPKAQLVLAKYLSDLGLLPGVTTSQITTTRGAIAARQVEGQGVVAAARCGTKVYIFTAADAPSLRALYESSLPADAQVNATEAEIPVPMYLDRWDKYGFRFYYGPFTKPQDANHNDVPSYDPTQDITFADQSGKAGLIVWVSPYTSPTADGVTDLNSRQWVFDAARKLKLPIGINTGDFDSDVSLANLYPDDMAPEADGYVGGWYGPLNFGGKTPAWGSTEIQDKAMAQLQPVVRDLSPKYDNIVNWMEPHQETNPGNCDWLDDHGADTKKGFDAFLKSKYGTPEAVAKRWSQSGAFQTWDDIPFPEVASFLGWNSQAIDLTGIWKMSYAAPYGAESAKPDLDESTWKDIEAPGNAIVRVLPRQPAVFRRHFKIDPAWRATHPKVWVYVWDLNNTSSGGDNPKGDVLVFMNGKAIPENPPHRLPEHWTALEVTPALLDGDNVLTLCLPQAVIDYRCYLSGDAPGVYPALGPKLNAEWADFSDWISLSREQAVRRGSQMIRQVDPNRPITMASPGLYLSSIRQVAEDYGGSIHDTGAMAGFWNDYNPVMAAGNDLPTDCESGSGATNLHDFKQFLGRWSTENTQGVDYFQHIGDVEWKPEIKDYFQKTLPLWHLIGKYHVPQPELAFLNSLRNQRLNSFPWNMTANGNGSSSPDLILASGFWSYGLTNDVLTTYPRAGITDDDFARGNADQFRVIVDTNTTIMDPPLVNQIEKWVRKGGIFVTFLQTGRHTSTLQDSWPIEMLTGYKVTHLDSMTVPNNRHNHLVDGQTIFHSNIPGWNYVELCSGQSLQKQDPTCVDLIKWEDGSTAVGMRKLGKGIVFNLGLNPPGPLVGEILEWAKLKRVPGEVSDKSVMFRHFVSNNGLDDVWVVWNQKEQPVTTDLLFRDGLKPTVCHDVNTGESIPIDGGANGAKLSNIALEPLQTRAFLTPRGQLASAPADWFTLQRHWWKGTADPGRPVPPYRSKLAVNLTEDWAFKPIDGAITGTPPEDLSLVDPKLDDSSWERRQIGIFDIPDHPGLHHAIFRKKFTVPGDWNHGKVFIWGKTEAAGSGGNRRYIDGQPMKISEVNDALGGILTPGSTHLLATEMWSPDAPAGTTSPAWISYRPDPVDRQPLNDHWSYAGDYLTYQPTSAVPIAAPSAGSIRCVVKIDPKHAVRNVVVHVVGDNASPQGLIFNGQWYSAYGNIYRSYDINVTPWVKFGQDNEVIVLFNNKMTVQEVSLDYYDKKDFP